MNGQSKVSFDDKFAENDQINLYSFKKVSDICFGFCLSETSDSIVYEL